MKRIKPLRTLATSFAIFIVKLLHCLIIIALPCTVCNLCAANQAFQVQGTLEQYNGTTLNRTYHFTVTVKDCKWLIHTEMEGSPVDYYEDSYDGTNVYHYLQFRGSLKSSSINTSAGAVEVNDIPNNKADYAIAPWLAYGSTCYFNKAKGSRVKPFFDWAEPFPEELNKLMEVDLKRSEQMPFVPIYIYSKDLNRRYRVLEFTNFAGLSVPREFIIECFNPNSRNSTNPPTFTYRGRSTEFEAVDDGILLQGFRPNLDSKTYTEDRRFPNKTATANELTYLNKTNQWLPTNDAKLVALYHQQLSLQPPESNVRPPSRLRVLILLACPTIALVIFAVYQWKRSKRKPHDTSA